MVAAFKWEAVCLHDDLLGELLDWHCLCGCVLSVLLLQDLISLAVTKCMPLKDRNLCHAWAVATLQLCVDEFLFYFVVTSKYFCDWHNTAKLGRYVSWICVFLDCMHFLSFCQKNVKFCLHACIFEPWACFLSYVFRLSLNWSVGAIFVLCKSDTLCKGRGSTMWSVTESSNLEFYNSTVLRLKKTQELLWVEVWVCGGRVTWQSSIGDCKTWSEQGKWAGSTFVLQFA